MAVRFLVAGGTGNWNSTTNWSATSGGLAGASFPVAGDTANLDSAANIAVNVASACDVVDMTGYTGTISGVNSLTVSGNLTLGGTITWTGQCILGGTGAQVVTCNGLTLGGVFRVACTGTVQFADTFRTASQVQLGSGTLDLTNDPTIHCLSFFLLAGTKVLKLGASQWFLTFTGVGLVWNATTNVTGLTLATGPGTPKLTFAGGALASSVAWGPTQVPLCDVEFTGGAGGFSWSSNNGTFNGLRVSGAGNVALGNGTWRGDMDFTGFTGTWNVNLGMAVQGNVLLVPTMTLVSTTTMSFRGAGGADVDDGGADGAVSD